MENETIQMLIRIYWSIKCIQMQQGKFKIKKTWWQIVDSCMADLKSQGMIEFPAPLKPT